MKKKSSAKRAAATPAKRVNKKPAAKKRTASPAAFASVADFVATLEHPARPEILALRRILLGVDPEISEGIKWNTLSFKTSEYFATIHLRAKEGVQLILHLGAKSRPDAKLAIADPAKLLAWLGKDRATIVFRDAADLAAKRAAFEKIVLQWVACV